MSATLKQTLWAVNIQGPDDLVPVASYDDALSLACTFNEWWCTHKSQKPLSENDPRMWATPVEYDGSAEEHSKWVKNPSPDYAPFFAAWHGRADGMGKWPKLTGAMIEAACKAHYGTENADGVTLTVNDRDWSFREAFKRMWKGARKAAEAS